MTTTPEPDNSTPAQPVPKRPRRGFMSRISIQSKLLVMLLVTSILSAAVVGFIGYQSGRSSLRAAAFDALTQIRSSQVRQLEAQFSELKNSLVIFANGFTATGAITEFTKAFDELRDATIDPAQWQSIVDYYNTRFDWSVQDQPNNRLDVAALLPEILSRPVDEVVSGDLRFG